MSLQTTVKTTEFAKKLRDRMKFLQEKRTKDLKKYDADLIQWKKTLLHWLEENKNERVIRITKSEVKDHSRYSERAGFNTAWFFEGAPKPPKYPDDRQIRDIRNTLRHLGITGQKTLRLYTNEVTKLLGDDDDNEV